MKKTAFLLLAFITISSLSCDKDYKIYGFDIEETIQLVFEPGETQVLNEESIELNIEQLFKEENTSADLVEKITIENVHFSYEDYSVLHSIVMTISAEGQDAILFASNDSIDYNSGNVDIDVTDELMDDYIKSSKITITTVANSNYSYTEQKTLTAHLRFRVITYVK